MAFLIVRARTTRRGCSPPLRLSTTNMSARSTFKQEHPLGTRAIPARREIRFATSNNVFEAPRNLGRRAAPPRTQWADAVRFRRTDRLGDACWVAWHHASSRVGFQPDARRVAVPRSADVWWTLERDAVSYTPLRAHETKANLVCRLLPEKKKILISYYFFILLLLNSQFI